MTDQALGCWCSILTAVAWAFALIFFKRSGERVPPLSLNLFKNTIGLVLLIATLPLCGDGLETIRRLSSADVWTLLASGFVGIALADTVFFHALNRTGVGIIAIVDCLYSPSVIVFAFFMLGERLRCLQGVGAACILAAVLVSTRLKPPADRTRRQLAAGIVLGGLSMAMMAFGIVLAKPVLKDVPLVMATTLRMIAGAICLVAYCAVTPQGRARFAVFRPSATWKWSVPGAFMGAYVSLVLWIAGFKYIEASVASILNQTSTVFAIILATVILREPFSRRKLLAVMLAVTGVVLVTLSGTLEVWLRSVLIA